MTMGRLNSAASSVAVPLATSVRSQAASTVCDWPSTHWMPVPASRGSSRPCRPGTTGRMKRRPGRASSRAAPISAGAMCSISLLRLPGSSAMTVSPSGSCKAARAASRGGSSGMASASGWPTKVASMPARCRISGSKGKRQSTWSAAALILTTRSGRQAQIDGQTKCTVLMPPSRSLCSRPKLKSGASTPMNTSGRRASSRLPNCLRIDSSSRRFSSAST
mmetsp:Transcript_5757/g.14039  ORF Transcript_5757/g.14039 Transcript_5757/m.14039 type:complete len:220 (-) Transcript_5757:1605-2264(-)